MECSVQEEVSSRDVQEELKALQKKCRVLESNRNVHLEDSQRTIAQQQKIIAKLKKENKGIKDDLALATKTKFAAPSMLQQQRVVQLNDTIETYRSKVEVERRRVEELEKSIDVCRAKAFETRKAIGGAHAAEDSMKEAARNTKILESRLDQALQAFNEAIARNKNLREEIDELRKERTSLEQIHRRLGKELEERKTSTSDILEATNVAYEARDQAESEIAALRAQADHEQALADSEMRELANLIEVDQQFSGMAGRRAVHCDESASSSSCTKGASSDCGSVQEAAPVSRHALCEQSFREAMDHAGIHSLDDFVAAFEEREKRNFALFARCSDMENEIEDLKHTVGGFADEIAAMEQDRMNCWGNDFVRNLTQKRDQTQKRTKSLQKQQGAILQKIEDVRASLLGVCKRLGLCADGRRADVSTMLAMLEDCGRLTVDGWERLVVPQENFGEMLPPTDVRS